MKKVFFIGMNRIGTTAFHYLFDKSGYRSVHYSTVIKGEATPLAVQLRNNKNNLEPILEHFPAVRAYGDLFFHRDYDWVDGVRWFEDLYNEFPDAYFVLQTRPMEGWLESKRNHKNGEYIKRAMEYHGLNEEEMLQWFEKDRNRHEYQVKEFFKDKHNLLDFDIMKDDIQDFVDYFLPDFKLNPDHWSKHNVSGNWVR